jgi:cardiolipin synthase (CMP-forming)
MPRMADATTTPAEAGEDRILTVPNLITLVRLLCIPLFLWLLFGMDARAVAAALLALLGATDWVDGYVARHFHQVSSLGKAFDPLVDRLLLIVGVLSIIVADGCPRWFGIVVVAREVILSAWVVSIMALGAERMDVTWWGKCGTFGMMVAFPAFLASSDTALSDGVRTVLEVIAWSAAIPGLVCSMIAFVGYFPMGVRALREGRAARSAAAAP